MKKVKIDEVSIVKILVDDIYKEKKRLRRKFNKRIEELIEKKAISYALYKSVLKTVKRNFGNEVLY